MKKIILLSLVMLCATFINQTPVFACQPIPTDFYKYLTLEQTLSSSTNIVISEKTQNGQASPREFPVSSQYDWIEMNVIQTLKGNLRVNNKIRIKTSDVCGYGQNFSDSFGAQGKEYLIFLGSKDSDNLWLPVVGSNNERGLRQYEIVGENIVGLNITVNNLKDKINATGVGNISRDTLIEGRTYTVAELNTNISTTARKFFTEAYVIDIHKFVPCPSGAECAIIIPGIVVSDKNTQKLMSAETNNRAEVQTDSFAQAESFMIGKKYKFEVVVENANMSKSGIPPNNRFTLMSVKNIDGSDVIVTTPAPKITDNQTTKQSFFQKLLSWFTGLFK